MKKQSNPNPPPIGNKPKPPPAPPKRKISKKEHKRRMRESWIKLMKGP